MAAFLEFRWMSCVELAFWIVLVLSNNESSEPAWPHLAISWEEAQLCFVDWNYFDLWYGMATSADSGTYRWLTALLNSTEFSIWVSLAFWKSDRLLYDDLGSGHVSSWARPSLRQWSLSTVLSKSQPGSSCLGSSTCQPTSQTTSQSSAVQASFCVTPARLWWDIGTGRTHQICDLMAYTNSAGYSRQ